MLTRPSTTIGKGTLGLLLILFAFLMIPAVSSHAQGSSNPTNYWKLDESGGSTFIDSVGGADAVCTDSYCPSSSPGMIGNGLLFDGINDGLDVPPRTSFNWGNLDSFSIEFWMKTASSSTCEGNQVILGRDDASTDLHYFVGCLNGGQAAFYLFDTSGTGTGVTGIDVTDGIWHHVVAVRDAGANAIRLYVDGKEGLQAASYPSGFDSTGASLTIGWLNLSEGYHFEGALDEIALYNRALTVGEIASHYYLARGYSDQCANPVTIMPLGDSITWGMGTGGDNPAYATGYRQPLFLSLVGDSYNVEFVGSQQTGQSATPSFDFDHEGRVDNGAWTASRVAAYVYQWLVENPADVVLLHIGTNDHPSTSPSGVASILDEIKRFSANTTVVLSRIINEVPYQATTKTFNDNVVAMANARIAAGDKIIIVDQENALDYSTDMADALHPNEAGYNKMATVWLNALDSFLPVCGPIAPTITSTPVTTTMVNQSYTYDVNAKGNPLPTYGLGMGDPSGMTIDETTGMISWIPLAPGTYPVSVLASNTLGSDTQLFNIEVVEPPPSCPSGMIHYWKLDEASGATSYEDYYGINDAVCTNNCPIPTTGRVNGAQQFDASTQLNVADDNTFDWSATSSFSIELWMKTDPSSTCKGNQVILGRDDVSTGLHYFVGCLDGGQAAFYLFDTSGMGTGVTGIDVTDGIWHHMVAVRDAEANEIRLFVDGIEGLQAAGYASGFDSTGASLNIGWLNLSDGYHFEGALDEVALYNRVLTDGEIAGHYSPGGGYCGQPAPVITSVPVTKATAGQLYTYDVNAIGTPVPTYSLVTAPLGMTIHANTGLIQWTPGAVGDFNVTVRAKNSQGSDSQNFVIRVTGKFTITATAGSGGSITPSGKVKVIYGASQTFTIKPATRYRIANVIVDGIPVGAVSRYTFDKVTANHSIAATYTKIGPPNIKVEPYLLYFDKVRVGSTAVKHLTIRNTGEGDLVVSKVEIASFNKDSASFGTTFTGKITIEPSKSFQLNVIFKPVSTGMKNAVVKITSNDPGTPVHFILLSGIGSPKHFSDRKN